MVKYKEAIYIDSPTILALKQIQPFFEDGIFGTNDTPLLMRKRNVVRAQKPFTSIPNDMKIEWVKASQLPVERESVLFYPFNSQSNMTAVMNRDPYHVLTLHGESNKAASYRPAARLYDYICIAGPLARDRYLRASIFKSSDADSGRLVMMGDSFVQTQNWFRACKKDEGGVILFCPTWEGYGNQTNNYSSVKGGRGFDVCVEAAKLLKIQKVVVRPHPYMGLLKPKILRDFVEGVQKLTKLGLHVELEISDCHPAMRVICQTILFKVPRLKKSADTPLVVKLGVCDVSGMEATFLKQGVNHVVVTQFDSLHDSTATLYEKRTIVNQSDISKKITTYLGEANEIDEDHRELVFGWHDEKLKVMSGAERRAWLISYVKMNPFWSKKGENT